jgi:alpha-tubulin suppressor-like RCC1 family protein
LLLNSRVNYMAVNHSLNTLSATTASLSATTASLSATIANISKPKYYNITDYLSGTMTISNIRSQNNLDIYLDSVNNKNVQAFTYRTILANNKLMNNFVVPNIVSVVAGENTTYCLSATGDVWGCGGGSYTGTRNNYDVVFKLERVLNVSNVVSVVISENTSHFLSRSGQVWACGANGSVNPTGTRTTNVIVYVPEIVLNVSNVASVFTCESGSGGSIYFLSTSGSVWACGYNSGTNNTPTGTRSNSGTVWAPESVLNVSNVVSVVCNESSTFFLSSDGTVRACGINNGTGITGTRSTEGNVYVPESVLNVSNIVSVVASANAAFFSSRSGQVWACGINSSSNPIGTRSNAGIVWTPESVLNVSNVVSVVTSMHKKKSDAALISTSSHSTFFLSSDGTVRACGYNSGTGYTGTRTTSGTVFVPELVRSPVSNVRSVVAAREFVFFISTSGTVWACGRNVSDGTNAYGITGTRTNAGIVWSPEQVLNVSNVISVVSYDVGDRSVFFLSSDGTVRACGANGIKVTGTEGITGTRITHGSVLVPEIVLSPVENVISVIPSINATYFLSRSGQVWACGANNTSRPMGATYTQLYVGSTAIVAYAPLQCFGGNTDTTINHYRSTIQHVYESSSAIDSVFAIDTSSSNVLIPSGSKNPFGMLGIQNSTNIQNYNNALLNTNVLDTSGTGTLSNIRDIQCGIYHTVFLNSSGVSFSCGLNIDGQLGIQSNIHNTGRPTAVGTTNFQSSLITKIACGYYHTVFLNALGNVITCGNNTFGQLGHNNTTNLNIPTRIATVAITGITDIKCGGFHTLMLKGSVTPSIAYACGMNTNGQIGVGNTTQQNTPVQVSTLTNISMIRCGKNNSLFYLNNDNKIYMAGVYYDSANNTTAQTFATISEGTLRNIYASIHTDDIYVCVQ